VAGSREVVAWLRQKARPYLFSNSLAPVIAAVSIGILDELEQGGELRRRLRENAAFFRGELTRLGFRLQPGEHPIIPVMLGEAALAQAFAAALLDEGVYAVGFFYPVVPKGQARIRTQMSAAHSRQDLEGAVAAFAKVGRAQGVIAA
jgi:glycine C-acetyltransferase